MQHYDPLDPAANRAAAEQITEQRKKNRDRDADDFKKLMERPEGRRFMRRLLDVTGVYRSSFRNSGEMAFLEGQRNIGLMLLAELVELCPDQYAAMLKEAKEQ